MLLSELWLKAAARFDHQSRLTSCAGEAVSCVDLVKLALVGACGPRRLVLDLIAHHDVALLATLALLDEAQFFLK